MHRVYLDWNATTPPLDAVVEAMARASRETWGNPSSIHADGRKARAIVEDAREAVAELFGGDARDVVLTSGGTEANNLAVRGRRGIKAIVTSPIEHPSIAKAAEHAGVEVRWAKVLPSGQVDADDVRRLASDGALVSIQAVNGETGVIQPKLDGMPLVHVDAVQAWGKIPYAPPRGATVSLGAHKMRGPKGIGALYVPEGVTIDPVVRGGSQERGIRPGTVDPIAAAGLAVAVRHVKESVARYAELAALRDELERRLVALGGTPNGADAPRVPHVTNVSFAGWEGATLVAALDLEGISISSGSACSAGTVEPSPVISAMHGRERGLSAIRVSMGETTTGEHVERAAAAFERVLKRSFKDPTPR